MTSALTKYAACIADACSDQAIGSQIPDEFGFPSNCSYFETVFHITAVQGTGSNSGVQNFDLVVTPSLFGAFCGTGTCTGSGVLTASAAGVPTGVGNGAGSTAFPNWTWISPISSQFSAASGVLATQAQAALTGTLNQFEKYRIVGVGCEIIDDTQDLSANGTFYFAEFPIGQSMPAFSGASPISFSQLLQYLDCPNFDAPMGATTGALSTNPMVTENISSLPVKARLGYKPFLDQGGTRWSSRPVAPDALEWRDPFNDVGPYSQGLAVSLAAVAPGGFVSLTPGTAAATTTAFTFTLGAAQTTCVVGSVLQQTAATGGPAVGATVTNVTIVASLVTVTYSPASASALTVSGAMIWSVPSTAVATAVDPEYVKIGGSTALAVRFTGPFNSSAANQTLTSVNVRIRYHIEGLVQVGSTSAPTYVNGNTGHPSGGQVSSNPKAMETILNLGARQTKFLSPEQIDEQRNMMMNIAARL